MLKIYAKMQSPDSDPAGTSIIYNDSGYFTTHNPEINSLSSNSSSNLHSENSHSENSTFEVSEDISLHKTESLSSQSTGGIYFCEDAVFDEPKLLSNTNNYEHFSSLVKFSLVNDSSNSGLPFFNQDSLSSLTSINSSNQIFLSENKTNIVFQANANSENSKNSEISEKSDKKCLTPIKTFKNPINPNLSPELFSEDEDPIIEVDCSLSETTQTQKIPPNEQFFKNDRKLLKRVQETLNGVPPPPSVTILQISVSEMLEKIYSNKHLFLTTTETNFPDNLCVKSLLISSTKLEQQQSQWPEIANLRYHGLHYNRSTVSEDFELNCSRYLSRYVGCETASSCTASCTCAPGGAGAVHRRAQRHNNNRWAPKSPGRRLSHLARRRITFSSANLQQQSAVGRLMIDTRKTVNKLRRSPRKKSPLKKIKTPTSSAKKRPIRHVFDPSTIPSTSSSSKMSSTKRALFQSPEHSQGSISSMSSSTSSSTSQKPRRALFNSPTKRSSPMKKRKRQDISEGEEQVRKMPRSQSFDPQRASGSAIGMPRRNSEIVVRGKGELSDLHKQKMLWAISESLRAHQITMSHPQFRPFASILCKIIKHQVPDLMSNSTGSRLPGSTSDRMLKIARQHVYNVTRGKSFQEILRDIEENKMKMLKAPKGYVAPESVLKDKVMNIQEEKKEKWGIGENKLKSIKRQILFEDNR